MSILKIARIGHPILLKRAKPIIKIKKSSLKQLLTDMTETLLDADGIGLAAPQIHENKRIIIFHVPEQNNHASSSKRNNRIKIEALINPTFKNNTDEFEDDWEGCLSIPRMLGKVRRYRKITYEGYDIKGNLIQKEAEGLHARIIQHECDHLDGILYTSKLVDKKYFGFVDEINTYLRDERTRY